MRTAPVLGTILHGSPCDSSRTRSTSAGSRNTPARRISRAALGRLATSSTSSSSTYASRLLRWVSRLRGAVRRANRVGYGFVVSSIVTSPSGSRSDRPLFHRNSTTARPRKRVWRSTTRATSWETRYVSRSLMVAVAPQSTAATRGRASSAARWVIGPGQTSPIHSWWRSELTQLLLSRECPNHLAAAYVFGTDLPE